MHHRLRICYLGPEMALVASATAAELHSRGHEVLLPDTLHEISTAAPPDVVIHRPLPYCALSECGSCVLAALLPDHVLLVPMITENDPAHAMFAAHAKAGNCHPKMLLHWAGAGSPSPIWTVDAIEEAALGPAAVSETPGLSTAFTDGPSADLGLIMASRESFARLLYMAALDRSWTSWGDLTRLLHLGDGVVRNISSDLGSTLRAANLLPHDQRWTAQTFTRFVTEHRSYILAYGRGHLGFGSTAFANGPVVAA